MRQKSVPEKEPATEVVKKIRRATRRHFSAEDKIRIVLEGLRGEDSIAELCRREGIVQNLYYRWSKDFDGGLHEVGREERERDRHIDLSNAAFVTRSNLLDTGHGASNNLIKPTPATGDRCDECGAGLGANGSTVVRRHASRHDDIASPLHWRLLPRDAQHKSLMFHLVRRIPR